MTAQTTRSGWKSRCRSFGGAVQPQRHDHACLARRHDPRYHTAGARRRLRSSGRFNSSGSRQCSPVWTKNGQMVGLACCSVSLSSADRGAAAADPFSLPVRPINSLLRFAPDVRFVHRVHVSGQVTLQWPGRCSIFRMVPRDSSSRPLRKHSEAGRCGGRGGLPAMGEYSLMLEDAVFKPDAAANRSLPHPSQCKTR